MFEFPPANLPLVARRGLMLVLSSPSGAGKTTISRRVLAQDPHISPSVSVTTRPPRPNEKDGKDYRFVTEDEFHKMVAKKAFLEHAKVFDNFYGTPRKAVEQTLSHGRDIMFDIDWQGAQQLAQTARTDLVSVFVLPPSMVELERRLTIRASDSAEVVTKRMAQAGSEISHWREYDYIIVNADVERSAQAVMSILAAERLRRDRQDGMVSFVNALRGIDGD